MQLNIHGHEAPPQPSSAPLPPSGEPAHLFTHAPQLRGQLAAFDQASLVRASLIARPTKDQPRRNGAGNWSDHR